jgi:nitrogen regulatory protein PII
MATIEELKKQKDDLEKQIEAAIKQGRADAVKEAKRLCKTYNITATELRGCLKTRGRTKAKTDE